MNKFFLTIFRIEILLASAILFWNALITVRVDVNYNISWKMAKISPVLLTSAVCLLFVGVIILSIPKVILFLRSNPISSYLIPMQIWIILVFIGMELLLRIAVYNQPFGTVSTNWFGYVAPKGSFIVSAIEGFSITQYDGPPGEIRTPHQGGDNIILLGDSFLEGLQVSNNQKFASVAETVLHQDGYNVDLRNLGRSGAAMADYVSWIPAYQALYHPRAIVLQLTEMDFIESFAPAKNNYFIAQNSTIVETRHKIEIKDNYKTGNFILNNFRLMLWKQYGKSRYDQITKNIIKKPAPPVEDNSRPKKFDANLAQEQMELLFKASNGTPLIIILIPHAPYISGNSIDMKDPKHDNIKEFLSAYPQVTIVDPLPEFQNLTTSTFLPMGFFNSPKPGWGHFNQRGNEVLGTLLAKSIEEVLK